MREENKQKKSLYFCKMVAQKKYNFTSNWKTTNYNRKNAKKSLPVTYYQNVVQTLTRFRNCEQ